MEEHTMEYVMVQDPLSDTSAEEIEDYFKDKTSNQDIADAYAITSNKFWWDEDDQYDFKEGTEEYKKGLKAVDEWRRLMKYYETKIFRILRSEGKTIPKTGRIRVLAPFMEKYGYFDGNGWWIRKQNEP
jgi:hypothetical protein